jgi:hypothetical protein
MLTAGTAAQYPHYDCTSTGSRRSQVADTPQPGDHASIKTSCLTRARRRAVFNSAWLPDFSGLYCVLAALACLAHAPRAWSRSAADSGVWSLALTLLAADAGAYRIFSLTDYLHDPHLIQVSLAELLILMIAVALCRLRDTVHRPGVRSLFAQQESSSPASAHTGRVWLKEAGDIMVYLARPTCSTCPRLPRRS